MKTQEVVQQLKETLSDAVIGETDMLGEMTLEVFKDKIKDVLTYLRHLPEAEYKTLTDLTGVDYIQPLKRTKVIYWLQNPVNYQRLRIAVYVERAQTLPSVIDLWEGANWYERELFDLFGVSFEGHPDMKRILMPDDWKGHPLRRDYALTEEPVEFKHGVKPKVPSEIIPYVQASTFRPK